MKIVKVTKMMFSSISKSKSIPQCINCKFYVEEFKDKQTFKKENIFTIYTNSGKCLKHKTKNLDSSEKFIINTINYASVNRLSEKLCGYNGKNFENIELD